MLKAKSSAEKTFNDDKNKTAGVKITPCVDWSVNYLWQVAKNIKKVRWESSNILEGYIMHSCLQGMLVVVHFVMGEMGSALNRETNLWSVTLSDKAGVNMRVGG